MFKPVILGITDEVEVCGCCGLSNLKRTVMIQFAQDADPVHYGTTCAANALNAALGSKEYDKARVEREAGERTKAYNRRRAVLAEISRLEQKIAAGEVRLPFGLPDRPTYAVIIDGLKLELAGLSAR